MQCRCGNKMIVIESRPLEDGRIVRRRHCFQCGQEAIGIEKIRFAGVRPHPPAMNAVYGNENQKRFDF